MRLRQYFGLLLFVAAIGSTRAWASDIQCAATRQPAERVICDHAILNNEYDDIAAQQQALLSSGKLSSGQLAQWRQVRNACTDVHCIDTVFAQWKTMVKSIAANAVAAPVVASSTDFAPVGPASDAGAFPPAGGTLPASQASQASQASPTSEASLVRQGSAAGVALPQPVASQASSPAAAAVATGAHEPRSATGLATALTVLVLIAAALGAFVIRRKRSGGSPKRH
ncbi:hypothetical protein LMG28727_05636 [Paraburkholderia kirstenboschensis]|uniref:hypothetical protein n=1 Tax=Paraburkholderia kirstenboschensis TaxID=1245436 RepID=UPI000B28FA38|nr:hypothetical protein [Paraburkholderia kirstenboschensis]CAD6554053.1 hypothetical protein LMG28727_05636 [Paraburkholderia kirstenboschensis]